MYRQLPAWNVLASTSSCFSLPLSLPFSFVSCGAFVMCKVVSTFTEVHTGILHLNLAYRWVLFVSYSLNLSIHPLQNQKTSQKCRNLGIFFLLKLLLLVLCQESKSWFKIYTHVNITPIHLKIFYKVLWNWQWCYYYSKMMNFAIRNKIIKNRNKLLCPTT